MKKYARRVTVSAEPMNEKEAQERFLTAANTDGHKWQDGYCIQETFLKGKETCQWMPKEEFEALFKPADTYMDRLREEREELSSRIRKLKAFSRTEKYHSLLMGEKSLLARQLNSMREYLYCLNTRIELEEDI